MGHKKHLAGLPAFVDDYDTFDTTDYAAIAADLRQQEDLEAEEGDPFVLSLSKDGSRNKPDTAANMPPLPAGEGWGEGKSPSQNSAAISHPSFPRKP